MFSLRKKLSLNNPQYTLLSGALISSVTGLLHNRIMTSNIQEYLSLDFGWLVGLGFNGPLRQYFSLYRAVSQREGERGKKG